MFRRLFASRAGFKAVAAPRMLNFSRSRLGRGFAGVVFASAAFSFGADDKKINYDEVRKDVARILDQEEYDDGSLGPVFVRLAWHAAGTYDKATKSGGTNGATMRFAPESIDPANNGLDFARAALEVVKEHHPGISYADLWVLAADVAIEEMGGPKIKFTPGRKDAADEKNIPKNGRLPDAGQGAKHIRDVFYRMGFNDQEIVALIGAHCLGRCHTDRSGFVGPWTRAPTTFSNLFFKELLENQWSVKQWNGPKQYADPSGELMMLPADLALRDDPAFRKYVDKYAKDEQAFFNDFAAAWQKLVENGFKRY
jgi:catalase (peroxidase I)